MGSLASDGVFRPARACNMRDDLFPAATNGNGRNFFLRLLCFYGHGRAKKEARPLLAIWPLKKSLNWEICLLRVAFGGWCCRGRSRLRAGASCEAECYGCECDDSDCAHGISSHPFLCWLRASRVCSCPCHRLTTLIFENNRVACLHAVEYWPEKPYFQWFSQLCHKVRCCGFKFPHLH